jgi:ATP-binding cassette subfamily C protein CydCD
VALGVAVLSATAVVVQAVAVARAVDRSLLEHVPLRDVAPELVLAVVALVVRGVITAGGDLSANGAAERVVSSLRRDLVRHSLLLGPGWLAGERPGELSLTATRGLRSLHAYYARYLPQAAAAGVVPLLLLAWVATQDLLSFAVVVALVVAVPVTMIFFGREATRRSERQWKRLGSLAGRLLQLIEGLPTLRAFGREAHGRREVAGASEGVRVATMRTLRLAFLSSLSMDLIAGLGVGLVAMVLGLRLLWGQLGLQTAMAVLLVAPEIFIPLRRAGAEFHASTEGQAAAARVLEVLETPLPKSAAEAETPSPRAPAEVPARPTRAVPTLVVQDLAVDHPGRGRPTLRRVSFEVAPGSRVALTGPSAAGKSTVLAALLRFVEPSGGTTTLDGLGPDDVGLAAWRSRFAYVPQRPHLFHATLADNVRLGAATAPDDELRRVLAAVGLNELVAALPDGLATVLGHDGLTLSAGERQRVALARALLSRAPVLLLDEPTASLDPPTVARLAPAVEPWIGRRSVLVAAHEPVLLPHFDVTIELRPVPTAQPLVTS